MIAAWMLYATLVAVLLCAGGAALDRLLRPHRFPVRWIWVVVLFLGVALPALQLLSGGSAAARAIGVGPVAPVVTLEALRPTIGPDSLFRRLDSFLLVGWGVIGLGLLTILARDVLRVRRLREESEMRRVAGAEVLVSSDIGPAVIGVLRPVVVIPRWLLTRRRRTVELAVLHEREHLRAGDPRLLAFGATLLLAIPWNLPVWWAFQRLREAVEVDCDARVLAHHSSARPDTVRTYARTLLKAGSKRAGHTGFAPALIRPHSFLERRIQAMTASEPNRPAIRAVALGSLAVLALAGACLAPDARSGDGTSPTETEPSNAAVSEATASEPGPTPYEPYDVRPDIINSSEVVAALDREYPPLLWRAGIGGTVLVWFYIDEEATVQDIRIRESSGHEALDRAALRVAEVFEFTPALNDGEPVPVWIALPISFVRE